MIPVSSRSARAAFEARFAPSHVPAGAYAEPCDVILFLHIPKTAGMSVGKALQRSFDLFHPVSWENTGVSFRQKSRKALYLRQDKLGRAEGDRGAIGQAGQDNTKDGAKLRQILMGHFSWNDVAYWQAQGMPLKCATIIRDPLERLVSNYQYNISDKHPQHVEFQARFPTLESYAAKLGYDYQLFTMIGASYDFDHALERLTQAYSFIGVTENLGASLEHFARSHGLPDGLPEHRENIGTTARPEISDTLRNMVAEKSRGDMALHALVKSYFAPAA